MKKTLLVLFLFLSPYLSANCCSPFGGLYVSGNVGFAQLNAATADLRGGIVATGGHEDYNTSWTAGVGLGYDYRLCNRLIGVVADLNWTHVKTDLTFGLVSVINTQTKLHWFSTFRARAGLSFCDFLFYLTGGAALTDVHQTIFRNIISSSVKKKLWGWTLGFGTEFAFCQRWSVNAEVLYLDFERHTYAVTATTASAARFYFDNYNSLWVGRIGLNYHFSLQNF